MIKTGCITRSEDPHRCRGGIRIYWITKLFVIVNYLTAGLKKPFKQMNKLGEQQGDIQVVVTAGLGWKRHTTSVGNAPIPLLHCRYRF